MLISAKTVGSFPGRRSRGRTGKDISLLRADEMVSEGVVPVFITKIFPGLS